MAVDRLGKEMLGQQFDPRDPAGPIVYTQQMMDRDSADAIVAQAETEIQPVDAQNAEVKVYDGAAIQAALDAVKYSYAGYTSINGLLPDVLTGVAVTFNKSHGDGSRVTDAGTAVSAGTNGGISVSPQSSAQASAAILPDVQPIIKQYPTYVPSTNYVFYVTGTTVTEANIKSRVSSLFSATLLSWPGFRPESVTLTLKGMQVSLSQEANSHESTSWSASDITIIRYPDGGVSQGYSQEVSVTNKTVTIPPTIHAAITLSSTSDTQTATTTVKANIPAVTGTIAASAITNEPTPLTITATGSISPSSAIPATNITAIPTTGLYIKDIRLEPYSWDRSFVRVEVVDFSYFA